MYGFGVDVGGGYGECVAFDVCCVVGVVEGGLFLCLGVWLYIVSLLCLCVYWKVPFI